MKNLRGRTNAPCGSGGGRRGGSWRGGSSRWRGILLDGGVSLLLAAAELRVSRREGRRRLRLRVGSLCRVLSRQPREEGRCRVVLGVRGAAERRFRRHTRPPPPQGRHVQHISGAKVRVVMRLTYFIRYDTNQRQGLWMGRVTVFPPSSPPPSREYPPPQPRTPPPWPPGSP